MTSPSLPPVGPNMRLWGENLTRYIRRTADRLRFKSADDTPANDGIILWDASIPAPVVSLDGEFRQVILADGYARLERTTNVTAAAADTAYAIEYDTPSMSDGITLASGNPTRITFEDGGLYLLSFSAQINSTSSSTVDFRFWPRVNGTDVANSTLLAKLHQNNASTVVSRSMIFNVDALDYIEAMWATSSTNGSLLAAAATAYAPAAPATTLSIERIRA